MKKLLSVMLLSLSLLACNTQMDKTAQATKMAMMTEAEANAFVRPFYDHLSCQDNLAEVRQLFAPEWRSYHSNDRWFGAEEILTIVDAHLCETVPDLKWQVKQVSVTANNEIVVRSKVEGTPEGQLFFDHPVGGESFHIMAIDIHTVKDGKIVKTYHVEDWYHAFDQIVNGG